jgi:hypothetical protein
MQREVNITQRVYELVRSLDISSLKKVSKGRAVMTREFKDTISGWYGRELPWPLVEPDLILVFEDLKRVMDDMMIVAIEVKYFEQTQDLHGRLRQSFRELGQPLRNLIFGFDSVVLWHIFSPDIEEEQVIQSYVDMIGEVIDRLKLPAVYLATTILDGEFKIYKPFGIDKYDMRSLASWLKNLCDSKRNPAMDREVEVRRKSLKVALRIPG